MRNAFWWSESWRSCGICQECIRPIKFVADSEVSNFDLPGIGSQKVARLQVTVNDFLVMHCERSSKLDFEKNMKNHGKYSRYSRPCTTSLKASQASFSDIGLSVGTTRTSPSFSNSKTEKKLNIKHFPYPDKSLTCFLKLTRFFHFPYVFTRIHTA